MSTSRVKIVTEDELNAQRTEILAKHPELDGYKPDNCCPGCITEDVRAEYGHDAAEAWERLDEIRFLLGGKW